MIGKILSIAFNSLRITFKEKGNLIWLIVMPIVFTILMGGMYSSGSVKEKTPLLFLNKDRGIYGSVVKDFLKDEKGIEIIKEKDEESLVKDLKERVSSVGVIIPEDFSISLTKGDRVNVKILKRETSSSYFLIESVKKVLNRLSIDFLSSNFTLKKIKNLEDRDRVWKEVFKMADNLFKDAPIKVNYEVLSVRKVREDIPTGMDASSPGFSVMFVMMGVLFAAAGLVRERENRTLRRLLTTPTNKFTIISGKMFGFFLIGFVQFMILILFGQFVLNVNWGRAPLGTLLLVIGYVLSVNGIGSLISVLVRTSSQAGSLAVLISIVTSMLGGAWWPIEIVSDFMKTIAKFTPQYWAINGFNKIIIRGFNSSMVLPNFYVLISISLITLFLSVLLFRFE